MEGYKTEKRECKDCKRYRIDMWGSFCSKKLMSVIPQMHVTYKISEGTCFESIEPLKNKQDE